MLRTVPETTDTPGLGQVIARNVAARRAAAGFSQAHLAYAMEGCGIAWTQSTVALIETMRRQVTAQE